MHYHYHLQVCILCYLMIMNCLVLLCIAMNDFHTLITTLTLSLCSYHLSINTSLSSMHIIFKTPPHIGHTLSKETQTNIL